MIRYNILVGAQFIAPSYLTPLTHIDDISPVGAQFIAPSYLTPLTHIDDISPVGAQFIAPSCLTPLVLGAMNCAPTNVLTNQYHIIWERNYNAI